MNKIDVKIEYIFDQIEDKVTEETGPMSRFIVNKVLWDMGKKKEDLTLEDLPELNKRILEAAIPDPERRAKIQQSIEIILKQTKE